MHLGETKKKQKNRERPRVTDSTELEEYLRSLGSVAPWTNREMKEETMRKIKRRKCIELRWQVGLLVSIK